MQNEIQLNTCDSTNRVAKDLLRENALHGTVVIADEQTAGRGRMGRSFYSPRGNGLYMSFVLYPKEAIGEGQLITCFAATALLHALDSFAEKAHGKKPQIKWVNDILIRRKKVAGILTEAVRIGRDEAVLDEKDALEGPKQPQEAVVLGIGVNLFGEDAFPAEIADLATVLFPNAYLETLAHTEEEMAETKAVLRKEVKEAILREIRAWDGSAFPETMIEEYQERSFLLGRSIHFTLNGEAFYGVVTSVLRDGNLMVVLPQGGHVTLSSGEVTLHKA